MRQGEVKFSFGEDERRLIRMDCFKRHKAATINEFICRAESTISYWLFIRESGPFGAGVYKRELSKIASTIKKLVREIDSLTGKGRVFLEIQANLEDTSIDELIKLKDAVVSLEDSLAESGVKTKTGPKTAEQELLIRLLADDYFRAFGKDPSFSEDTPFHNFCSALAPILGINLGPAAFSSARLSWRSRISSR